MNLNHIQFTLNLKNREIPKQDVILNLTLLAENERYPMGIIPFQVLSVTDAYSSYTTQDNYNYFLQLCQSLFANIYTQEEIAIIAAFLLTCLQMDITEAQFNSLTHTFLFLHSERKDIEYCLNTIRYNELIKLLYLPNTNTQLTERLFSELENIEEEYNNFRFDTLKLV